jgi:hypothetical protein
MKTKVFLILVVTVLIGACPAQADTVWLSGHHEIIDSDIYGEIWMYNDCTLDILGGDIYRLAVYDTTVTNWYGGEMVTLWAHDESIVNIYGGQLGDVWAAENSYVYLYAYDVTLDDVEYILSGRYYSSNNFFSIDVHNQDIYSHIFVIPEPATFLLLILGGLLIKRRC